MRTLLLCCLLLFPSMAAFADTLQATLGQPIHEISHSVDVTLSEGVAIYKVQRSFANAGDIAEELSLTIDLPVGAVATGLRIRAKDTWYDGELLDREEAAKRYSELTGIGHFAPKDPALLEWETLGLLHLYVFPVFPGSYNTIEYTLTVPTEYQKGQYFLSYPVVSTKSGLASPVITVHGQGVKSVLINNKLAAPERNIVLVARQDKQLEIDIDPSTASLVESHLQIPEDFVAATVQAKVTHTYRGDLQVVLVSPSGKQHKLHNRTGSSENDLNLSLPIELASKEATMGTWTLYLSDHAGIDTGTLTNWSIEYTRRDGIKKQVQAEEIPIFIPDAPNGRSLDPYVYDQISISDTFSDKVKARLGKVEISKGKEISRFELDVAPQLSTLPRDLSVIFVLDISYSIKEAGVLQQKQLLSAYMSHLADGHAEVIVTRRKAERLFGQFVNTQDLQAALEKAEKAGRMALGNGSAIDEGLAMAASVAKQTKGASRIVVLSDTLLRDRFANKLALDALQGLPKETVVHLLVPEEQAESAFYTRDDKHPLAEIPMSHGGIFVNFQLDTNWKIGPLKEAILGLVRPTQIDNVTLSLGALALSEPLESLVEGMGLREMQVVEKAADKVVLSGQLWSTPWKQTVASNAAFSKTTAAFVFSGDLYNALSDEEQKKVAMFAGAVSPVTSYLAIEPGVRPSVIGIDREGLGLRGFGSGGGGSGVGYGVGVGRPKPDLKTLVAAQVKDCQAKHAASATWSLKLDVETTYDEIVDVVMPTSVSADAARNQCIEEAIWATRLDGRFSLQREKFSLSW